MTDRFDEMAQAIWLGAQGRGALADALRKVHEEQAAALDEANRKLALLRAVAEVADQINMCFGCGCDLVPDKGAHCDPPCAEASAYIDENGDPPETGDALEEALKAAWAGGAL